MEVKTAISGPDLMNFIHQQNETEPDYGGLNVVDINKSSQLLNWYLKTEMFKDVWGELIDPEYFLNWGMDWGNYENHFVGRIFEDIASAWMIAKLRMSKKNINAKLISPRKTLEVYKKIYPEAIEISSPFDLNSLQGISVPDGLIKNINTGKIIAVCEYTLSFKIFEEKKRKMKKYKKELGKLGFRVQPILVLPDIKEKQFEEDIAIEYLPFGTNEFRELTQTILSQAENILHDY